MKRRDINREANVIENIQHFINHTTDMKEMKDKTINVEDLYRKKQSKFEKDKQECIRQQKAALERNFIDENFLETIINI
ncbi:MAG: hypothetical protein WCH65_08785 [bacterium]